MKKLPAGTTYGIVQKTNCAEHLSPLQWLMEINGGIIFVESSSTIRVIIKITHVDVTKMQRAQNKSTDLQKNRTAGLVELVLNRIAAGNS